MPLTIKEAREIWALHLRPTPNCNCANGTGEDCQMAKGYLEAIKQVKPLIEALEKISKHGENRDNTAGWAAKNDDLTADAIDALSSWHNLQGEEIGTVYEHSVCKCEKPVKHWCDAWGLICDCGGIIQGPTSYDKELDHRRKL